MRRSFRMIAGPSAVRCSSESGDCLLSQLTAVKGSLVLGSLRATRAAVLRRGDEPCEYGLHGCACAAHTRVQRLPQPVRDQARAVSPRRRKGSAVASRQAAHVTARAAPRPMRPASPLATRNRIRKRMTLGQRRFSIRDAIQPRSAPACPALSEVLLFVLCDRLPAAVDALVNRAKRNRSLRRCYRACR